MADGNVNSHTDASRGIANVHLKNPQKMEVVNPIVRN